MARTHKDRHKWKNKERKRTGKADPKKIQLHRERFLTDLEQICVEQNGYRPIVFQARLRFLVEDGVTELWISKEKVGEIPFLVDDPNSCHYVVAQHKEDFNSKCETEVLLEHVQRVRFLDQPCHLLVQVEEKRTCSSIASCHYRLWDPEKGLPICTMK